MFSKKQVKQKLMIAKKLRASPTKRGGQLLQYQKPRYKIYFSATLWETDQKRYQKESFKNLGRKRIWPDTQNPKIVNQKLKEKTATNPRHSSLQKF